MNVIKKILSTIGILGLLFIGFIMLTDDDTPTETQKSGNSVIDGQNEPGNSEVDEQGESGDSKDNEGYYNLVLEDGTSVDILKPQSMINDLYKNLNEQREHSIFTSIYNYDHNDDVYVMDIPNSEQTLRDMMKEPYAIGSVFHFVLELYSGPEGNGLLVGDLQGDSSIDNMIIIDPSYLDDSVNDFMGGEIVSFDAVYAGLDIDSDPTFIALKMTVEVQ